jgi:hypothetical protein
MEQYVNDASGILASSINDSDTVLSVTDASLFPATGVFRIRVEDEIMEVTSVSGLDFTVVRGDESTIAAAHLVGVTIKGVLTAKSLKALPTSRWAFQDWNGIALGVDTTDKIMITDGPYVLLSNNTIFKIYGPTFEFKQSSTFGYTSFGSADFGDFNTLQSTLGANAGSTRVIGQANNSYPSTPYAVKVCFLRDQVLKHISGICFGVRNSTTEKMTYMRLSSPDDYATQVLITNSDGGTHTDIFDARIHDSNLIWFKVSDDGTDQTFSVSFDSRSWTDLATYGNTTFHGGSDQVFWGLFYDNTAIVPIQAQLLSWEQ